MLIFARRAFDLIRRRRRRAARRRDRRDAERYADEARRLAEAVERKAVALTIGEAVEILSHVDLGPYHFAEVVYVREGQRVILRAYDFSFGVTYARLYPVSPAYLRQSDWHAHARAFEAQFREKVGDPIAFILSDANDG